jgi:hypothetical protein
MLKRWGAVAAFCGRKNREITELQKHQATAAMGCSRPISTGGGRSNLPGDPTHAAAAMIEQYEETINAKRKAVADELEFARQIDTIVLTMRGEVQEVLHERYVLGWSVYRIACGRAYVERTIFRMLDEASATVLAYMQPIESLDSTCCQ